MELCVTEKQPFLRSKTAVGGHVAPLANPGRSQELDQVFLAERLFALRLALAGRAVAGPLTVLMP